MLATEFEFWGKIGNLSRRIARAFDGPRSVHALAREFSTPLFLCRKPAKSRRFPNPGIFFYGGVVFQEGFPIVNVNGAPYVPSLTFGFDRKFLSLFSQIAPGLPVGRHKKPKQHASPLENGGSVMALACSRFCADVPSRSLALCAGFARAPVRWSETLLGTTWRFLPSIQVGHRRLPFLPAILSPSNYARKMPNYFFIDASGQRQGPVNDLQLQTLAAQGIITPNTPLETDGGHKGTAGQIPGLSFGSAAHGVPHRTHSQQSAAMQMGVLARKAGVGGILSWLLDFAFQDLRLPVINLWACRIIYVICCIAAILWGLFATFMFFSIAAGPYGDATAIILGVPLAWLGATLFIFVARLLCEWEIIVFNFIIETTRAARLYIEKKSR